MWTKLGIHDVELLGQWVEVMRPMNRNYHRLAVGPLRANMCSSGGEVWYFADGRCEIALRFQHNSKRNAYQLQNVGVVGSILPQQAVDLIIAKCLEVIAARGLRSLIALRPKNMDDPFIEQFHQLIPRHPDLEVVVRHDARDMQMWEIAYRGQAAEPSLAGARSEASASV